MKKKIFKSALSLVLVGVLALGFTGCGSNSKGSANSDQTSQVSSSSDSKQSDTKKDSNLTPFRIGIGGSAGASIVESAGLAIQNGYFEEELAKVGYVPEYVYFSGAGPEINEAFAGQKIDAAIVGDFPTLVAKSNGIDNTIVAVTNQKVNYGILTTVKGAKTIEDLEGKTAVVFGGSITQFFWQSYLQKKGVDYDSIPTVNSTDATTLLTSGDAQIYPVTAYMSYTLEEKGLGHVIDTSDSDIWTTFVFEVSSKLLKENDEIGTAVNKALIRAAKAAQDDPKGYYKALAGDMVSASAWEKYYSADPTLANLSPEITDEMIKYYKNENKWLLDNGVIKNSVDISTFVNTSYYEKAKKELK